MLLPQLRHPLLLQFKDSVEVEEKNGGVTLFLVTEAAQPLATLLQELRLGGTQRCGRSCAVCAHGGALRLV